MLILFGGCRRITDNSLGTGDGEVSVIVGVLLAFGGWIIVSVLCVVVPMPPLIEEKTMNKKSIY